MIKIPICYSFNTQILDVFSSKSDKYIPIGCGGYTSNNMKFNDNTGDNISEYNKYINEMTLMYWIIRNYDVIGNPDYIGIAHYRRYLDFNDSDLNDTSIICSIEKQPFSIYKTYCTYHVKSDIDMFIRIFAENMPEYKSDFFQYMSQNKHAKCNMFVMSRDMFSKYSDFIIKCIDITINKMRPILNLDARDAYQMRALGFILERMTGFWIYFAEKHNIACLKNANIIEEEIKSIYSRS